MKMTMINKEAVTTLFPCITGTIEHHYSASAVETKAKFPPNNIPSPQMNLPLRKDDGRGGNITPLIT
jgi:hypothetical protein